MIATAYGNGNNKYTHDATHDIAHMDCFWEQEQRNGTVDKIQPKPNAVSAHQAQILFGFKIKRSNTDNITNINNNNNDNGNVNHPHHHNRRHHHHQNKKRTFKTRDYSPQTLN